METQTALQEITEVEDAPIQTSKDKLRESLLSIVNNSIARVSTTEMLISGLSELLMQRMLDVPEKFRADFLVESIKTLTEANNSSTAMLIKTMSPQKEGESIVNLIVNNTVNGQPVASGNVVVADNVKLQHVNSYLEVAQQVIQADAKKKQINSAVIDGEIVSAKAED